MAVGTRLPPQLLRYWSRGGAGGEKIRWGEPSDFYRCTALIEEAVTKGGNAPLSPRMIKGLCATLHKLNTGATPGNAPGERALHAATHGNPQ